MFSHWTEKYQVRFLPCVIVILLFTFTASLSSAYETQFSARQKLEQLANEKPAPAKPHVARIAQGATPKSAALSPSPALSAVQPAAQVAASAPPPERVQQAGLSLDVLLIGIAIAAAAAVAIALWKKKIKAVRHWSLTARVTAAAVGAAVPLVLVVLLYIVPTVREKLYQDKIDATKQVVDVAYGVMVQAQDEADRGIITPDQARQKAFEAIQKFRYNTEDYFWINDLTPTMIMHPFKPEMNGKNIGDNKDPNGKRMFTEMVDVCKARNEGSVEYMWPKPGVEKPVPKISYVKLYKPWGWIVGSGIYVEDVEAQVNVLYTGIMVGILLAVVVSCILGVIVGRIIKKPVQKVAGQMANADLNTEFHSDVQNEIGDLERSFDRFVGSIRDALHEVMEASVAVASATTEISQSAEEMAAGTQEQTSQAGEVASAVEEMTKTIVENSRNATATADMAKNAKKAAETGGKVVQETITGMQAIAEVVNASAEIVGELGKSSDQIGQIINVIDDIADQTNLLALNAAIEAARAGDQGRGFAVVADEVRKLAERTTKATKEIAEMIKKIQNDTSEAVRAMNDGTQRVGAGISLADKAGVSLREILEGNQKVTDMVSQIAVASEEQSSASEQISKNVEAISTVTGQTAAGVQQIAKASEDLNRLTENLEKLVGRFKLKDRTQHEDMPDAGSAHRRQVEKAHVAVRQNGSLVLHQ